MRFGVLEILLFTVAGSISTDGQTSGTQKVLANDLHTKYFSSDYEEARKKFLDASRAAGASIESIVHPNTGPKGKPLYTDVAFTGPRQAKRILMLVSGTHGIEGFAGSGIQTGLLREEITSRLDTDMAVVMVHAINPYGFAYLRRANEDNVDLNRNFVDHSLPYPENPGYEKLSSAIAPNSLSLYANITPNLRFMWYRLFNGKDKLKCAITAGQYSHPKGLFYGRQENLMA